MRASILAIAIVACAAACRPAAPRYVVTASPIDVGLGRESALCLAVDPEDPQGVWWWEPGRTGCDSRSTGPDVFRGQNATITEHDSRRIAAAFRLPTHSTSRPFVDVRIVIEAGEMRAGESGGKATVERRPNLTLPELPPYGRRGGD